MIGSSNAVSPDPMDYFNFTVDLEAAGVPNAYEWWGAELVRWDNLPMTPTFQIAQSVTSLASFLSHTSVIKAKLVGGSNVTDMSQLAYESDALQEIDLSELDMSNVTNLATAFRDCDNLRTVNINQETQSLTDVSWAFYGCDSLENVDFSKWKAENLTDVSALFFLAQLGPVSIDMSGWRTTKVTDMSSVFRTTVGGAKYINISGWTTESLIDNSRIFQAPGIEAIVIDSPSVFRLTSNEAFQYNRHPSVYVPDSLVDEYKAATNWVLVADQIKPLSELPQEIKDVFHM